MFMRVCAVAGEGMVKTRDELERIIEDRTAELRRAHVKLLGAQENERKQLATELHDHFAQELVALQLMLKNVAAADDLPADLATQLGTAADRCSRLVEHVRRVSHGLYPPMLKNLGLYRALQSFALISDTVKIDVRVDWDCGPVTARFSPELEIALFRVAQEAVTNAMRHAAPRHIRLSVSRDDDEIRLAIADDGCGFDPEEAAGRGLGLQTMKERVTALAGRLEITADAGGTTVAARVPAE